MLRSGVTIEDTLITAYQRVGGPQGPGIVQVVQPGILVRPRGAAEQRAAVRARALRVPGVGLQHGPGGALDGVQQLPLEVPLDSGLAAGAAARLTEPW